MTDNKLNVLYGDAVDVYRVFTCPKCNKSIELLQELIFSAADNNDYEFEVECLQCGETQHYNLNTDFDIKRFKDLPYRIARKG